MELSGAAPMFCWHSGVCYTNAYETTVWIILIKISLHTQIVQFTINNLEFDPVEVLIDKQGFRGFICVE